jgi:hypothetical protein
VLLLDTKGNATPDIDEHQQKVPVGPRRALVPPTAWLSGLARAVTLAVAVVVRAGPDF